MKKKIKWGVIGSGGIARRRTIPEGITQAGNSELVAVYDIDRTVNQRIATEYNVVAAETIPDLFASGIDVVYVASPVNNHFEHVIASARAGKHVFCEKSIGLNVEEAVEMVQFCRESGVYFGTGFMMRFTAQHQAALKLIRQGSLGKPVYGRGQLSCWYPPIPGAFRQDPSTGGGGSLIDMGSHCIDLLEMFFGPVKKVSCFINNSIHSYPSEDSAVVSLFFENGAMATVDSFFCIPDNSSKNMLELYGSKGSILAKGTLGQGSAGEMIAYLEENNREYDAQQMRDTAEGMVINPVPVNPYMAEIEEFSSALLEHRTPLNDASVGLQNQKVVAACYLSAASGKVIDIE